MAKRSNFWTIGYMAPVAAVTAPLFLVQSYLLNYSTDVLLIPPLLIGAMFAIARIWDAISDPLVGYLLDRTRFRHGARRMSMLISAPALALTFLLIWIAPNITGLNLAFWLTASLLSFYTLTTCWSIAHISLAMTVSQGAANRAWLFGLRFAASVLGVLLAFTAVDYINNAPAPQDAARAVALVALLILPPILMLPALLTRETPVTHATLQNPWRAWAWLVKHPPARHLSLVWLSVQAATSTQAIVSPYIANHVIARPDLIALLPAAFITGMLTSIPVWSWLAGKYPKVQLWRTALLGASATVAPLFAIDLVGVWLMLSCLFVTGFFTGATGPFAYPLLAELVEKIQRSSGESIVSSSAASWEFLEKVAGAVVLLIVALLLHITHFQPMKRCPSKRTIALEVYSPCFRQLYT